MPQIRSQAKLTKTASSASTNSASKTKEDVSYGKGKEETAAVAAERKAAEQKAATDAAKIAELQTQLANLSVNKADNPEQKLSTNPNGKNDVNDGCLSATLTTPRNTTKSLRLKIVFSLLSFSLSRILSSFFTDRWQHSPI